MKLTQMPLWLLSFLERFFFSLSLFYYLLMLWEGFQVSLTKKQQLWSLKETQNFWLFLKSHHKRFLFEQLTHIPLQLLLLLERSFFSWFLLYSILVLKEGVWFSFTEKNSYSDFLKRPKFLTYEKLTSFKNKL